MNTITQIAFVSPKGQAAASSVARLARLQLGIGHVIVRRCGKG